MKEQIIIRNEMPDDIDAITETTVAAFKTLDISNHTEHFIVKALRKAGVLTISLVAELDGKVVGHIAFSPVTMSDGTEGWFGLGPVSVLPELHRQGIGSALIEKGLERLKELGANGCCLVGHPGYCKRFGFENVTEFTLEGVPAEAFHAISFNGQLPKGFVQFHEAFMADA